MDILNRDGLIALLDAATEHWQSEEFLSRFWLPLAECIDENCIEVWRGNNPHAKLSETLSEIDLKDFTDWLGYEVTQGNYIEEHSERHAPKCSIASVAVVQPPIDLTPYAIPVTVFHNIDRIMDRNDYVYCNNGFGICYNHVSLYVGLNESVLADYLSQK